MGSEGQLHVLGWDTEETTMSGMVRTILCLQKHNVDFMTFLDAVIGCSRNSIMGNRILCLTLNTESAETELKIQDGCLVCEMPSGKFDHLVLHQKDERKTKQVEKDPKYQESNKCSPHPDYAKEVLGEVFDIRLKNIFLELGDERLRLSEVVNSGSPFGDISRILGAYQSRSKVAVLFKHTDLVESKEESKETSTQLIPFEVDIKNFDEITRIWYKAMISDEERNE